MGGGGAERQLAYLAGAWTGKGLDVHVALFDGGPNLERLRTSSAVVHRIPRRSNYDPGIAVGIVRLIRTVKPDIVQTWIPQMDVLGGVAALWAGVPFVVSERSSSAAYPGNWKDRLRGGLGRRAARIVANSEVGRAYWISLGKGAESIAVIRNGIPFEEIDRCPAEAPGNLQVLPEEELIVYAGRLSREKNLWNLVEATRLVLGTRPRARMIFFGEGPQRESLAAAAKEGPFGDRLRIHGYTDSLWGILKRANVFASVSTFEGNPNTVLEAAACRCPILLSDIPAHRELLDGESAFFVPPSSVPGIAEGVTRALEQAEEARRRAAKAYSRVLRYSIDAAAEEYLSVYRAIRR
jgi:glycosyltransferase involved in cell wall biosynthesis